MIKVWQEADDGFTCCVEVRDISAGVVKRQAQHKPRNNHNNRNRRLLIMQNS